MEGDEEGRDKVGAGGHSIYILKRLCRFLCRDLPGLLPSERNVLCVARWCMSWRGWKQTKLSTTKHALSAPSVTRH